MGVYSDKQISEYLSTLHDLENYNAIKDITYKKENDISYFVFYVKNQKRKQLNKYEFKLHDKYVAEKFMDLYKRHEVNSKIKSQKAHIKKLGTAVVAGMILVGTIGGTLISVNNPSKELLEINSEAVKAVQQIQKENPDINFSAEQITEMQREMYNKIYNERQEQKNEEASRKYQEKKEKYEQEHKEKLLGTNENLEDYMNRTYAGDYNHYAYQDYMEYKNNSNSEDASKTR